MKNGRSAGLPEMGKSCPYFDKVEEGKCYIIKTRGLMFDLFQGCNPSLVTDVSAEQAGGEVTVSCLGGICRSHVYKKGTDFEATLNLGSLLPFASVL